MCATCSCAGAHDHDHPHRHGPAGETVPLGLASLDKHDRLAAANRAFFAARGIAAFNFTGSPGSGKTSLLEALIRELGEAPVAVIAADQETERDAARFRAAGAPVVQVNTHTGCHLDAEMVAKALRRLDPAPASLLFIENVGNLACPALVDLGERAKVAVLSVTEGEDKPLKYPHMFRAAEVLVLTKTDLLPHLDFDLAQCLANLRRVNPSLRVFQLSARDGRGVPELCRWIADDANAPEAEAG